MELRQLLAELGLHFQEGGHRNVRQGWLGLNCPWCGTAGKYHLGIELVTQRAFCWQCGRHRLFDALLECSGRPASDVWRLMQELPKVRQGVAEKPSGRYLPPEGVGPLRNRHRQYLRSRGFDPDELVRVWGVGGIGRELQLSWRIFLPIAFRRELVSWTSRSIDPDVTSKYYSARPEQELLPHKSLLYGWDLARTAIIVCEGPMDAIRLGPGAVATLGVHVTPSQIWRITRFPKRVIAFDNELKAQQRAEKLAAELSAFPGQTDIMIVDAPDPGSASRREVRMIRKAVFSEN